MRHKALKCATLRGRLSIGSCCTVCPLSITPALGVAFQEPCESRSSLHFLRRFRNTGPIVSGTLSSKLAPLLIKTDCEEHQPELLQTQLNMFAPEHSSQTPHTLRPASGFEFIFLGTGTSGSLPNVSCLTAPEGETPCKTCLSTLEPGGKKNIRRNTSAVIRVDGKDGKKRYVL